jgi:acyl dehydratase
MFVYRINTGPESAWSTTVANETGPSVGDEVTYTKTISAADVEAFAEATGDHNPLHTTPEYAQQTRFEQPIAHGFLVSGVISAALACLPGVVVYVNQNLSFSAPVFVGDGVTATCTLIEEVGSQMYTVETTVSTDGNDVVTGTATILLDEAPPNLSN